MLRDFVARSRVGWSRTNNPAPAVVAMPKVQISFSACSNSICMNLKGLRWTGNDTIEFMAAVVCISSTIQKVGREIWLRMGNSAG